MNLFDDDLAREWLNNYWIFEAIVFVGARVYWHFVTKEDGFPWGDYEP